MRCSAVRRARLSATPASRLQSVPGIKLSEGAGVQITRTVRSWWRRQQQRGKACTCTPGVGAVTRARAEHRLELRLARCGAHTHPPPWRAPFLHALARTNTHTHTAGQRCAAQPGPLPAAGRAQGAGAPGERRLPRPPTQVRAWRVCGPGQARTQLQHRVAATHVQARRAACTCVRLV
jgi:hypothetical protein